MKAQRLIASGAAFILLLYPTVSRAQSVFAGYDAFCGLPVVVSHDPQTATARRDQSGNPFIHIDPGAMANWTISRMFTLAHECAHHLLGHTTRLGVMQRFYGGTRQQELEADCWAARALRQVGQNVDLERMIWQNIQQGHFAGNGYPSGHERAQNILNCIGNGSRPSPEPRAPRCYLVTEYVPQVEYQVRYVQQSVPCSHYVCNNWACGYLHAYDVITVPQQVPITRQVPVQRRVCN
jgi:hypothetical protein